MPKKKKNAAPRWSDMYHVRLSSRTREDEVEGSSRYSLLDRLVLLSDFRHRREDVSSEDNMVKANAVRARG